MRISLSLIIVLISIALAAFILAKNPSITGQVVTQEQGCCLDICATGMFENCQNYDSRNSCSEVPKCNVGCCIDTEGYCLDNVLEGRCQSSGYEFIDTTSCEQEFRCMAGPSGLTSYYGYANVLGREHGMMYAEPFSGRAGDEFMIYGLFYNTDDLPDEVEIKVSHGTYERLIYLSRYDPITYEEIPHNNVYTALWNSRTFPTQGEEHLYEIAIAPTDNELAMSVNNQILLSTTECYPITQPFLNPTITENIIFIADPSINETKILNAIFNTMYTTLRHRDDAINFHVLHGFPSDVETECPFYNETKDYIIHLTDADTGCVIEDTIAELNADFAFQSETGESFSLRDLCNHIFFPEQFQQELINRFTPPEVLLISPSDGETISGTVTVTFMINSLRNDNPQFNYSIITYDAEDYEEILQSGTASSHQQVSVQLSLTPGEHDLFIEVEDELGNLGFNEYITITVE